MIVYAIRCKDARKLAYHLLAWAAGQHWGMEKLPEVAREERGKPYFPQFPNCRFNVSHSGDLAVCALSDQPVGVDIQTVRQRREKLMDRVCSADEREWLRRRGDRAEDFSVLWALKESRCKQSGEGLRLPLSGLSVPLPEEEEKILEWEELRFWLAQGADWRFALCGSGDWDGIIHWIDPENLDN